MDLTTSVPRSPNDMIAGIVFVTRAIDKMRAKIAGTLGEYNAGGLSTRVFDLFGIDSDTFEAIVQAHDTDEAVLAALLTHKHPTATEIAEFNAMMIARHPDPTSDYAKRFLANRDRIAPGRSDIYTHFDFIDIEEGREVPHRTDTPDWARTS